VIGLGIALLGAVAGAKLPGGPHGQCIMKKRPASEGRSCDGRSNCNGESGAKEPQKDIGKSAREWHFDLEGKDNR
jgi:hypothetical protein